MRGGEVLVNFICRFEQLKLDFEKVLLNLSLNPDLFELPHLNKTQRNHYSEYYDDESREIVAEKYKTDIEKFGYAFESKVSNQSNLDNSSKISTSWNKKLEHAMNYDFISKANQLKQESRWDEAIATYRQAISINPSFPWYYYELGDVLVKNGLLNEAILEYSHAIKLNPNSAWFYVKLGDVLVTINNLDEAIAQYCISLELKPHLIYSYKSLENILQVQGYSPLSIADMVSCMKESSDKKDILPCRETGSAFNGCLETQETKVFCIGLGKTGTTTLEACFQILGYKNFSWHTVNRYKLMKQIKSNNFSDVFLAVKNYSSFRDYPFPFIYKELHKNFSDSKFILTVRKDFKTWFTSLVNHYNRGGQMEVWYDILYGSKYVNDENHYRNFYENHNKSVLDYFSELQERLIVICWENGDGWDKLCSFLNKGIPNVPLPHKNKT